MTLALEAGPALLPICAPKVVIDQAFEEEKKKEYFGGTGSISVYRTSYLFTWSSILEPVRRRRAAICLAHHRAEMGMLEHLRINSYTHSR